MRTYLITGAGQGIGKAIARALAASDSGNRLILLGRRRAPLEALVSELPGAAPHRILIADLCEPEALRRTLGEANLAACNLAAVIANAGTGGENHYGPEDRWDRILRTNLTGTYTLIQECLPALRASTEEFRNIVVISSILAKIGVPKYSAYCASKAGLLGLTRSLAAELASERILVNAICPGWVDTEMSAEGLGAMAEASGLSLPEIRAREMGRVPLGKMSQPQEVAELVRFLVGGAQTSVTGQAIDINNGAWMG